MEICVQRHRTGARGEKSTTTPDEGSERKGVSRAQGGEGGAPPQDPPQDQPQALHVWAAPSAEAAAARASRKTWKSEEDGGSQFCLVGPVSLGREADARENH